MLVLCHTGATWHRQDGHLSHSCLSHGQEQWASPGVCSIKHRRGSVDWEDPQDRPQGLYNTRKQKKKFFFSTSLLRRFIVQNKASSHIDNHLHICNGITADASSYYPRCRLEVNFPHLKVKVSTFLHFHLHLHYLSQLVSISYSQLYFLHRLFAFVPNQGRPLILLCPFWRSTTKFVTCIREFWASEKD